MIDERSNYCDGHEPMDRDASTKTPPRTPDDDPYLWLEQIDGVDALAWVDARTAETLACYGDAAFVRDRDLARDLLERPDRIPFVSRREGLLYNFWRDDAHPRGLWRRTDEATYRAGDPVWEIPARPRRAPPRARTRTGCGQGRCPSAMATTAQCCASAEAAATPVVLREFDLPTRAFVADGFILPEAKAARSGSTATRCFYPARLDRHGHAVRLRAHRAPLAARRGPLDAPVVFETTDAAWASGRCGPSD